MAVHGTADNALGYYPNESKHHYGAEPSFHRSASQRNAALVLVRAYVTPWTRPKPPINALKWSPQGITPIYSRSAFYDYSCRCLLCSDTPVTDLINFALASPSLPPTKRTEINYLKQLRTKRGIYFKPRAVIMDLQHEDLSWILCRALTHITFVINSARN